MSAVQQVATSQPANRARLESDKPPRALTILTVVTVIAVAFGLYMGLVYARADIQQGEVQRIFYIHMPAFFGAFFAFSATVVGGVMYLRTRAVKWDTLALAGVEVGLALAIINVITGAIWARPIWNTWWTWDPRLTTAAIMALTYAAYLMLRSGIDNPEQRRRFASIYGILAITTVILTLVITRIRPDTIHPVVIAPMITNLEQFNVKGYFELAATPGVGAALGVNFIVWGILVPTTLVWQRIRLENLAEQVSALKAQMMER